MEASIATLYSGRIRLPGALGATDCACLNAHDRDMKWASSRIALPTSIFPAAPMLIFIEGSWLSRKSTRYCRPLNTESSGLTVPPVG